MSAVRSNSIDFFLGTTTPAGFKGYFEPLRREPGMQMYLIKSGPGCGKSTLMKRLALKAEQKGEPIQRIHCASDPDSLDGVIFLDKRAAIVDATAPHVLEPDAPDFERRLMMLQRKPGARYRINHISWWAQELPSDEEYDEARQSLNAVGWQVDYIITHCAPTSIALMGSRHNEADRLTDFLQEVRERAKYHYWLFGHYHDNKAIDEKHILLWEQIVRII